MRRRDFIKGIAGSAAAFWPLAARAQQPAIPVIGYLSGSSSEGQTATTAAFRQGLSETGYVEGKSVAIEYRWANGQYEQLPALAADLVHREVAVIATSTPVAALAAKRATTSIPIVFATGSDPVRDGIVPNLNRPGANITGATFFVNLLAAKRLELLHQLAPKADVVAVLLNPKNLNVELERKEAQEAAQALGLQPVFHQASNEHEIDELFADIIERHVAAILTSGDVLFSSRVEQIAAMALRNAIPTCFANRLQAVAGGLMSYGARNTDTFRQVGNYVGRILKGERPGELPVLEPSKFEFVINLNTAKTLGLTVPPSMLLLADEVIE
jgi:putative ABC transport system substrate-binding protein